jgi:uncharacterized protein (DUF488 family)
VKRIYSIGHSTRSLEDLVQLLVAHGVTRVADVRSFPASRRHPHFARAALEVSLPAAGLEYRWMRGLGGMRHSPAASSPNRGWRVEGFRAYADHMLTPEFETAITELEEWASAAPTAFMCAEAYYRKCHRQLLSDALLVRGWEVLHIASESAPAPHTLTGFARVLEGHKLVYPGDAELPFAAG